MGGNAPLISLLLSDPRVDPNVRSHRLWTPLHEAVHQGYHVDIVRLLISDPRVDINAAGENPHLGEAGPEKVRRHCQYH